MNDTELDRLVRTQAAIADDELERWDLDGADQALLAEIVAGRPGPARIRRTRLLRRGLLVTAAASVAALAWAVTPAPDAVAPVQRAYGAEVLAVAGGLPHVLLDDPDWRVTYASVPDGDLGELHFGNGDREVQVSWYPVAQLDSFLQDRRRGGAEFEPGRLFGRPATISRIRQGHQDEIFGQLDDTRMVNVQLGSAGDELDLVMGRLRIVSTQRWLDALPPQIFTGDGRALAIDEMLRGIPTPRGYDPGPLKRSGLVSDRYQLGVTVSGDIACAWVRQWFGARDRGDSAARVEAEQALLGSRDWPVLKAMASQGAFPESLWDTARTVRDGASRGGVELTYADIRNELGCSR
jgi:hypothetical protein